MVGGVDEIVGQSLALRPRGPVPTAELLEALERTRPGVVVLFRDNVGSPAALHALVGAIQERAAAIGLPPPLVAIDQEGGIVSRLEAPFTIVPGQMAQAATGDPEAAARCARITGRQLRAMGVTVNLAPVLDVNTDAANPVIGLRSFGDDPAVVARFGEAAVRGYRDAGIVATVKHFPGHGDTRVDSHFGLPAVRHGRARLEEVELAPFAAAIRAGAPAVMTAHIVFPALDERPATLSPVILGEVLRGELGFEGVVFTDALDMRAIADRYGAAAAARLAKAAGADVVMPLGTLAEQIAVVESLRGAARDGEVPRSAFVATAERLARLRSEYELTHDLPPFALPDPALGEEALAVAERSVTLVQGRGALPLPTSTRLAVVDCARPTWSPAEEAVEQEDGLLAMVQAAFPRADGMVVGTAAGEEKVARAREIASGAEVILFVTRDAERDRFQEGLGRDLAALGVPVVHAAVRSPYDAGIVPGSMATLLTFGDPAVSLQALVAILAGRSEPVGSSPVHLPSQRA